MTLTWERPANTGGPNVTIDRYVVGVLPTNYICRESQCNTTSTNTTITNLKYGEKYKLSVAAVNQCVMIGSLSPEIVIRPLGKTILYCNTHTCTSQSAYAVLPPI